MDDNKGNSNVSSGLFPKTVIGKNSPENKDTTPKNVLQFENLISGLSTALVDTPEENLEKELNNWVKKFVEFLKVDRCIVIEYLEDPKTMHILINYIVPDVDTVPVVDVYQPSDGVIEELEKGIIIRAETIPDDLPQNFRGSIIERDQTKSTIIVPLSIGNRVIGGLSFASYRKKRKWSDDLVRRIKLIGEMIANAILRIRSHKNLLEEVDRRQVLEERYTSVIKTANVGFWTSDKDQNILAVNDEYCRMSGYSREELLSMKIPDIDGSFSSEKTEVTENIFNTGAAHHEATHKKKDGSLIDLDVSSTLNKREKILFSFMRDITELNQRKKEQEERLGFEELVSEFSAALINIKLDDLNEELEKWTIKFVKYLEIGRGVINEYQYDNNTIKALVSYTDPAEETSASPHDMDLYAPDIVMNEFKKSTAIRAEKIPEDLQSPFHGWIIEKHNTKSLVVVPLTAGNQVIGNLTFASYRKERKWPDDIFKRIKLIGEIIANAVLRKRASDALIEEMEQRKILEERYSSILKTANVGFLITDQDQNILVVNDEYCRMSGYSQDELLKMKISDLDISGDPKKVDKDGLDTILGGSLKHESRHIKKDGNQFYVEISTKFLVNEGVFFSFIMDITELTISRKELEERLKFEELVSEFSAALVNVKLEDYKKELKVWLERFAVLMSVDRCIISEYKDNFTKHQFIITYTKPEVESAVKPLPEVPVPSFGYHTYLARGEILKFDNSDDCFPGGLKKSMLEQLRYGAKSMLMLPLMAGDVLLGSMSFYNIKTEKRWTQDLIRMLKLVAEIFANTLIRDKTDYELDNYRKHLEEMVDERTAKLKDAQNELVVSEKMATLGKLMATVSHELRNPLGTIRSSIYSVQRRLNEKDIKVINALDRAERNIKRCDLIIDELLNYSRVQKLNLESTPIDIWINEVLEEIGSPDGIIIERQLRSGAIIDLDQERFRRSIVNILNNAYQAIQEKNDDGNGCVRVQTCQGNNSITIDISDNGVGFDMDNINKIYEPLYSTKTFGVGLGIPITLQIIEQHGWSMEMKGMPQQGSSVIITIPVEK